MKSTSVAARLGDMWLAQCDAEQVRASRVCVEALLENFAHVPRDFEPRMVGCMATPGSGKSTLMGRLASHLGTGWVRHDFDIVMNALDGYHDDVVRYGSVEAMKRWEIVARGYGYHILDALVQHKIDVLFDHSNANRDHPELWQWIKAQGYSTFLVKPEVPVEVATARLQARFEQDGRYVPLEYIPERKALLDELEPTYRGIVDKVIAFDNTGPLDEARVQWVMAEMGR